MAYTCTSCGESHEGIPLSFAADYPDMFANMSEEARSRRAIIGTDQCIIDSEVFCIRGLLEIPVIGEEDRFLWGLWAGVTEEIYNEVVDSWEEQGREKRHRPFKGRLVNSLSVYPETFNLKMTILMQPVGVRPLFIVDEADHPLAVAQQNGMNWTQTMDLVSRLLHP